MAHWAEQYIGLPYEIGSADCAKLVTKVRREIFKLPVPEDIEADRACSMLGRVKQMNELIESFGELTNNPNEGDVVLMIAYGRPSHIGIFCIVNGEKSVLHAMESAKMVVLHKIRDLPRLFLGVEGYYKWKT